MKVTCITAYTPTPENKRGISALIYWLLKDRPANVELSLYSYNMNLIPHEEMDAVSEDLKVNVHLLNLPKWYKTINRFSYKKILSLFLSKPLITYVKPEKKIIPVLKKSDIIWIYPYFFYNYSKLIESKKFIISGCDCISHVCSTRFSDNFFISKYMRELHLFFTHRQCINVEKEFCRKNIVMHYVGLEDCIAFRHLHNAENAFFLLHPHYALKHKQIKFGKKLKVLIAGKNDHYMTTEIALFVSGLITETDLKSNLKFTFLGKGWEAIVEDLVNCGFECCHKMWVDDYIDEIIKHDVQITPISNGGGTKGKVLDSIGNGLLTIGSKYALENICVRDKESCLFYRYASEIPSILRSIIFNKEKYERIAAKGRQQVCTFHDPKRISKRFFEIIQNL